MIKRENKVKIVGYTGKNRELVKKDTKKEKEEREGIKGPLRKRKGDQIDIPHE